MDEPLERRAVISGAAQSDIGRRLHRSGLDLTIEAALRAVDDAGLTGGADGRCRTGRLRR